MGYRLNLPRLKNDCSGKVHYETRESAERMIGMKWDAFRRRGAESGYELDELRRLNAYFCPRHRCFHLGRTHHYVTDREGPR